jgi:hypothetical protein
MTGFEPATTRPPDEDSTGLNYIPNFVEILCKNKNYKNSNTMAGIFIRKITLKVIHGMAIKSEVLTSQNL